MQRMFAPAENGVAEAEHPDKYSSSQADHDRTPPIWVSRHFKLSIPERYCVGKVTTMVNKHPYRKFTMKLPLVSENASGDYRDAVISPKQGSVRMKTRVFVTLKNGVSGPAGKSDPPCA
jgi:hypothetical protein